MLPHRSPSVVAAMGAEPSSPGWAVQAVRYRKMWVRTKSTLGMVGSFIFVIYMGHVPLMFMIFAIQARALPHRIMLLQF